MNRWTRRDVLGWTSAALAGPSLTFVDAALAASKLGRRPGVLGVMSGDPAPGRARVWTATDRPSRMWVEWSVDARFTRPRRVEGPVAVPETGFTAQVDLTGLPPGHVHYRVQLEDATTGLRSRSQSGRLWTPPGLSPSARRDLRIGWGGDVVGQGFGIDPSRGGLRMFEVMRNRGFDLFIHSGDHVYADNPLPESMTLDDGSLWTNVVTGAKRKVAETLDEFRGQYVYNMLDESYGAFFAETPVVAQWDDHETRNNWYPSQILDDGRYREKSVALLSARARRAFREFMPIRGPSIFRRLPQGPSLEIFVVDARSFRGPNSPNRQPRTSDKTAFFGEDQLGALERALLECKSTWKLIASDMPLGLIVPDGPDNHEGLANGPGRPLGREHELARLLSFIKKNRIRNVVFVTADVHYAAAHHYDPRRAAFEDFDPFWEFVAGPLHAGTFGPNTLDPTFGPEVVFSAVPEGMKPNRPPSDGRQYFGEINVDGETERMTVSLHDLSGRALFTKTLEPMTAG